MFASIRAFFTVARRQSIYAAAAVLVPLLVSLGLFTEEAGGQYLAVLGALLGLGAAILQITNFTANGLAGWFVNVGRLAIYSAAGVIVPALVFFNLIPQDAGSVALAQLSSFLSTIAALVGIFYAPTSPDPEPAPNE